MISTKTIRSLFICSLLFTVIGLHGQSNGLSVYRIFQDHCVQCHDAASPAAGLDLEGVGSSENQRWLDVYGNINNVTPSNTTSASKGDKQIVEGRPDKSFLFRKLNLGLEPTIGLDAEEGGQMPLYGNTVLSDTEKEIIRQWILFGAKPSGTSFDESIIATYYTAGGLEAFPDGPPPPPAPEDGFQIKMGPFFLKPAGGGNDELEFFQKYQLDLPEDTEVIGLDHKFSGSSHHFIVYRYDTPQSASSIPAGLRTNSYHNDVNLVTAVQQPERIDLPVGSAFRWDNDAMLDLNSHYINYSLGEVYKAEVYLDVYTQSVGTAAQEMKTALIPNVGIYIPNNETEVTIDQNIVAGGLGEIYLWGLMGHTHQYGTGYKVWTRKDGAPDELIYDAACPEAVPDCVSPEFDYQHIPLRFYDDFLQVNMTGSNGLIHQASWLNDGPSPLFFGPTSDDEMMVLVMMYLEDVEGVATAVVEPEAMLGVQVYPNPMTDYTEFIGDVVEQESQLHIFDALGRTVYLQEKMGAYYRLEKNNLAPGIYFYEMKIEGYAPAGGKLVVSE